VEDLIKRLNAAILDPQYSAKLAKISESTQEALLQLR
jgi:hypothetical protein